MTNPRINEDVMMTTVKSSSTTCHDCKYRSENVHCVAYCSVYSFPNHKPKSVIDGGECVYKVGV